MPDIFLSYSREDQPVARRYAETLAAQGFEVWWDTALRGGEAYDQVTEKALKEAKAVLVLWSKTSVESRWVRSEATLADRNKTLLPVMIEPCDRPIMFELTQTADLTHWQGASNDRAWLAVLADLRRLVESRKASQTSLSAPLQRAAASGGPAKPAILILPFVNMSGDQEQEYFSDGVTEDIITDLGRVSALSVVSRNAAFAYKGRTIAAAALARDLNVSHILEGSVRRSGNRVRLTAQLVEAASDAQVWADRFDRTLDDIFAIQDEISQAIVAALKLKLAPAEKKALEQRMTSSPEAYEFFLLARQFSRTGSERMKPIIVRVCRKAVELDPKFARAWALMSAAQSEMAQNNLSDDDGRGAAQNAVEIDPNLAEARAALAETLIRGDDLAAGMKEANVALALDPECFEANMVAGYGSLSARQYADAIRHFERAAELDRESYRPLGMVVQAYEALGDIAGAKNAAQRSLTNLDRILAVEPTHGGALSFYVNALARVGEVSRARVWAQRALLYDPDNVRMRYNLACCFCALEGEADAAIELLGPAFESANAGYLRWIENDSDLDPVRGDPRFVAMWERARQRLDARP